MGSTRWATPRLFFNSLDKEFKFTLDVAALPGTAKCSRFFTPEIDGLKQDWVNEVFFMNPPYGRGQDVYSWIKKAYDSTRMSGTGVCLLPASADTKWFHEFCMKADEIRFIKDRLWFELDGNASRANHSSMIIVFRKTSNLAPKISSISNCRERKIMKGLGK